MSAFIGPVRITKEDINLLEILQEVDGENGTVFIYDEELRKALKNHGFVMSNNIGWMWGTTKLRSALPKLKKAVKVP